MVVKIIGGGLAGSEAAWQAASLGIAVELYEMRPTRMTAAHKTGKCAELVCSNSFRGASLTNAVGLLKEELRTLDSLIMKSAEIAKIPAGGALAVDRVLFSERVDSALRNHPLITVIEQELKEIPDGARESPVIVATGPLTTPELSREIRRLVGADHLAFYDAISPIITRDSIDTAKVFFQSRYDKGGGDDYMNIPLTEAEYTTFVKAVCDGEKFSAHAEVENELQTPGELRPFEGCMPIEDMVERGEETLRFGPLKPTGLTDPRTGERPHAVIQLRQDDQGGELWSMVGMQTRLKQGEQLRIFRSLPGLENAEFVRLGTVHRNTFMNSPTCLEPTLQLRSSPGTFFAGQITGVEGYVESTAGGIVAGINAARSVLSQPLLAFPKDTAIGSLMGYISEPTRKDFQPMNISFGLMESYFQLPTRGPDKKKISKDDRRLETSRQALASLQDFVKLVRATGSATPSQWQANC